MAIKGKIKKRETESQRLEFENSVFFTNKEIILNTNNINFSSKDKIREIKFPLKMSPELAEEIGIHLGDGCLSYNRNYFSVKCNKKEEKGYMISYMIPLYKKLYNLDLKLMRLPSVSGFEVYSKALFEFKNKVIGIPYGEKIEKIEIPQVILKTKNKEIYYATIRGLFDTDGCVYITKKKYPTINITIKSKKLIGQVSDMLLKLGFIPSIYKWTITLNGPTMLNKWIKEINSNNQKNIKKLKQARASSSVWIEHDLAEVKTRVQIPACPL